MQVHLGPLRNNSTVIAQTFGPDAGTDSIGDWTQAEKMSAFLDRLDQEDALPKTIVYNNNPADNFVISTMLGNFQRDIPGKMQFGSGWWHSGSTRWNGRANKNTGQYRLTFPLHWNANRLPFLPFLSTPRIFPKDSL